MLSNFSWLAYGIFILVSLLIYYAVILLLYYRQEMRTFFRTFLSSVPDRAGTGKKEVIPTAETEDPGLLGKVALEDGLSSVSMEELDFGSNDQMLQGDLADCMEELNYTFCLAKEKSWDAAKLTTSFIEIAECYREVFSSKLRSQLLGHICKECSDKLEWKLSPQELEALFAKKGSGAVPSSGKIIAVGAAVLAFFAQAAYSQDGNQGIAEATNKVAGYFDTGTDLMYAIGAIMGLVGAVKVYSKWNAGEPDTAKVATAWFGSCIFLVVVATVLKSFFGI
ncbi:protein of unknown function [Pedobacter insulae]|uniref:Uncharacterized protein n=1 Tax=Pedobacter insulae TaxID=414048 RepID=A0A1I2Z6E7_9SPHI|nr:protein of unknown function [Pedobacter insulae]